MRLVGQSDRTIAPGQTEQVKFTVATRTRKSGPYSKSISVKTNDPARPRAVLRCTVPIRTAFQMEPRLAHFGMIDRAGGPQRKTFDITAGDAGPIKMELVPPDHPNVKAELREIEAGAHYKLDVQVDPQFESFLKTNITLKTGIEEVPEETLPLYAQIAPRLRADPLRFSIRPDADSPSQDRVELIWSGGQPGEIVDIKTNDPALSAKVEEADGKLYVVLDVPAGYSLPSGRRHPYVLLKTNDPKARAIRISVFPEKGLRIRRGKTAEDSKRTLSQTATDTPTAVALPHRRSSMPPTVKQNAEDAEEEDEKQSGCGCAAKRAGYGTAPKPSPEGPQPQFVCKETEITAEPVWRGENVDFKFEFANEGEGDLQIKLKPG